MPASRRDMREPGGRGVERALHDPVPARFARLTSRHVRPIRIILAASLLVLTGAPSALSSPESALAARLSLREKVGQLVMFAVQGTHLSVSEATTIRKQHLSNVILFAQNYDNRTQLESLTRQIQKAARAGNPARVGALISGDQEGGVVKRFPDMPPKYSAPQMGAAQGTSLAYNQGRATGKALRSAGVNVDLAPVADLDLPPEHVMRSRSFGSKPKRVGRLVRAFGRGLQSRKTAPAVKHFPGLGGANVSSDDGHAYIRRSRWELRHIDAVPFKKAIAGNLRMVMLSHGIYVHDGGERPASVNFHIATERLRRDLGFSGVAISDALGEVAWRFGGSTPRTCRATVKAGVDIPLITGNVYAARDCAAAIRQAVRSGDIPERRLDQAVERVLELKAWLGLIPTP
jgi:beta-N-acetylhexosaminidase